MWPGMGMSLKVDEVLFEGRSDFQVGVFTSIFKVFMLAGMHSLSWRLCDFKNAEKGEALVEN